jgi:hypothetical protein
MRQPSPSHNKETETIDLDQLFDQYVETDQLHTFSENSTAAEPSSPDTLAHLFELDGSNGCDGGASALPNWDADDSAWQPVHHQNPASPYSSPLVNASATALATAVYPQSHGRACLSDPGLFTLSVDALLDLDSVGSHIASQPCTTQTLPTRRERNPRALPERSVRAKGVNKQHNSLKKSSLSSFVGKMIRPSHYRTGIQDLFTRRMDSAPDHFNIAIPPNGLPHSPPPSTKLFQNESTDSFFVRDHNAQPYTLASNDALTTPDIPQSNYQLTPLSSPALDANSARNNSSGSHFQYSHLNHSTDTMASTYMTHHLNSSNAALSALQSPPPSHGLQMSAWGPPDASPGLDFGSFPASSEFSAAANGAHKAEGWWSGPAPVTVTSEQPPSPGNTNANAYSNARAAQDMSFTTASVAGLGISCDSASFSSFGQNLSAPRGAESYDMASYSSMYAPETPGIPIGTVPANPRSSSRSPSSSPQPRFTRRRHPVNSHTYGSQPMPIHSSRTPSSSHRRKSSSNSSTQSRAASQSAASGGGGFVNFTPSDSRKILTGVAPSGSSKTKARREKEAADKRRKLSQAAVRAVVEAGGDLGRLEKEIMVLES